MVERLEPDIRLPDFVLVGVDMEVADPTLRVFDDLARLAAGVASRFDDKREEFLFEQFSHRTTGASVTGFRGSRITGSGRLGKSQANVVGWALWAADSGLGWD